LPLLKGTFYLKATNNTVIPHSMSQTAKLIERTFVFSARR
jgi:hypothetical protein